MNGESERYLRARIADLEVKLKLEMENNIAVGGLLKRLEAERNARIAELEGALQETADALAEYGEGHYKPDWQPVLSRARAALAGGES